MLDGVARIAAPGAPGSLCVYGPDAFAVVVGGAGRGTSQPVVAATRLGKGRGVAFGHDGYFVADALAVADTGRLMLNAVRWAGGEPVGVRHQPQLLKFLQAKGIKAEPLDGGDWRQKLSACKVLCTHPNSIAAAADLAAVADFVKAGGGFVAGDTGWGWLQLHPGKTLVADHAGNRLLAPAGLVWADGFTGRTDAVGFATTAQPPELVHAGRALDALLSHEAGKSRLTQAGIAQASWTLSAAARAMPPGDKLLLPRLRQLERSASAYPTPDKPLTMKQPLERVLFTLQVQELMKLPPDKVKAHPAAAAFPGAVPKDAPRIERTVDVDTSIPSWHSTGLYAAPGGLITVGVPQTAVGKRLMVRIGAHSDTLWGHDTWRRCPEVCRMFPIDASPTRAANAFGGLVYIEVPGGCKLGKVAVRITGAMAAPHYVLGRTNSVLGGVQIGHQNSPWTELETPKIVLTVPSSVLDRVTDPEAVMKLWDRVLDAEADLACRPRDRERPERYVTDVQIGAGHMHSGYPIMTHLDIAPAMLDTAALLGDKHGGVWGLFHELGHNHQSGDWTFDGTGEVTVNLFTLYVYDKVLGREPKSLRNFGPEPRAKTLRKYLAAGPDFAKWKSDPFLALLMYIQLQEGFGWDAYKKVFAEYRDVPGGQRPKSDDEKRDQWMVRFSRAVGRNLGPFFQAWGVPTSERARASIADLPAWMPEGFPPK